MHDDPALIARQSAYLDHVRELGRRERTIGLMASLIGVLILAIARLRLAGEPWALWTGVAIIAFGWAAFVYSVARRILWVRAHPFDPNAIDTPG